MAKLTLVMGLPGAGKSTHSKKLKGKKIHIDDVRFVLTNTYKPGKNEDLVYETVKNAVLHYLQNNVDVVVDGALLSRYSRERIIKIGKKCKSAVTVYWLDPSLSLIEGRLNKRNKIVAPDRFITMEYVKNLSRKLEKPSDKEGIDELYYLSDEELK